MLGSYIVVFKDTATKEDIDGYIARIKDLGGTIKYRYDDDLMKGLAATIDDKQVQGFRQEKEFIDFIEPDGVATTQGEGGVF
ncbi:hypothetical protein FRC12_022123 [Ceratobasidium sp. 428]|nr:hypothetical protein FRC12_022123 [Ceratobasidium sp. 428]